jgi:hypothetical protein
MANHPQKIKLFTLAVQSSYSMAVEGTALRRKLGRVELHFKEFVSLNFGK